MRPKVGYIHWWEYKATGILMKEIRKTLAVIFSTEHTKNENAVTKPFLEEGTESEISVFGPSRFLESVHTRVKCSLEFPQLEY